MAEVEFIYNGIRTLIKCKMNEKMKNVCKKFKEQAGINNNVNIIYAYDGKVGINEELAFEEMANLADKTRKKMSILVYDNHTEIKNKDVIKSKNVICPKCKECIKMDIKDYKINLKECQNGHNIENILLNEFEGTQKIDLKKIVCDICHQSDKSKTFNNIFHKCLTCNKNICHLCKSNHEQKHKTIDYDNKYYICNKHNEYYISYCEECKINLCLYCKEHKDHKRILFTDILPNKEELNKKKEGFNKYIKLFNKEIDILKNLLLTVLNEVKNKMNIYSKINEDIFNNYNENNINYETIYYLNAFQDNNIIEELKKVIECSGVKNKFNNLYNIYSKMNIDEINIIYDVNDLKEVRLFGKEFVEKNNNNCKLIIEGYEQDLKDIYNFGYFFGSNRETFEIKLTGITNITDLSYMFYECSSLLSFSDISKFNTSIITNMSYMFKTSVNSCQYNEPLFGIQIGIYNSLFSYTIIKSNLISLPDISKWDTFNVINMSGMFQDCSSLLSLPDISKWNTSNVSDMSSMFSGCKSLLSLPDISKWNTSNVTNMRNFFGGCRFHKYYSSCSSLKSLPDISKWNISKVTDMSYMFDGCSSLKSLPDISKWKTSNITCITGMFWGCELLSLLPDISKWNTSNVSDMSYLFYRCRSLSSLPDISTWDTSKVTNMVSMFEECESLLSLPDIAKWNTSNAIYKSNMFYKCKDSLNIPAKFLKKSEK